MLLCKGTNSESRLLVRKVCLFADPHTKARRSATFLPEVAAGEAWSCSETLEHLIAKSGYHGCYEDVLPILEVTIRQKHANLINSVHCSIGFSTAAKVCTCQSR